MRLSLFLAVFALVHILRADSIAFLYALDTDFQTLKAQASIARQPVKVGESSVQILTLAKHKVYAIKMGSGAVETAISAQALFSRFRCDLAISIGPVGTLSDDLEIGKWYRVSNLIAYQKGSWTSGGFRISKDSEMSFFYAAANELPFPPLFQKLKTIRVASGEIFISSSNYREQLRDLTNADAVDMNLFGLSRVCADHHLPLINFRIVSDKADDNAAEDFRKFTQTYDGAGGKAAAELIRNLPPNPNSPESYPELQKLLKQSGEH
jgi:adenosylhomocysteine nucleosidase